MNFLGKFLQQLIGNESFAFERRRDEKRKAKLKANKRKKPNGKHRKPKPFKW